MENLKNHKLAKWVWMVLCLYVVALTCSIAGMELGAALLTLTAVFVVVSRLIRKESLKFLRFQGDFLLWGFIFFIVLGAALIPDLSIFERREIIRSSRLILTLYALLIAFWVLRVNATEKITLFLKTLFSAMIMVASYGIVQFFTGIDILRKAQYTDLIFSDRSVALFRVKSFYTNTMSYSYIFGMLFCVLVAFWYLKGIKFKNEWVLRIAVPIVLTSLFLTFTRGLWIGLIAALLVMSALLSWRLAVKTLIGIVFIFGILMAVSPSSRERIAGIVTIDQSSSERLQIWQNHWAMFKDHPLLGVGFEQNGRLMQEYNHKLFGHEWRVVHAHNHFLQILTGVGIFGFLFFLNFSLCMYWLAFKLWFESSRTDHFSRAIALGSIGAQTVFHVGGLTEAVFVDRESNHAYLLVIALTIATYSFMQYSKSNEFKHI